MTKSEIYQSCNFNNLDGDYLLWLQQTTKVLIVQKIHVISNHGIRDEEF